MLSGVILATLIAVAPSQVPASIGPPAVCIAAGDVVVIQIHYLALLGVPPDFSLRDSYLLRLQHRVWYNGEVHLGRFGTLRLAGLTPQQATKAVNEQLSRFSVLAMTEVCVFKDDRRCYYIIAEGADGGRVYRRPITGTVSVADALGGADAFRALTGDHSVEVAHDKGGGRCVTLEATCSTEAEPSRVQAGDRILIRPLGDCDYPRIRGEMLPPTDPFAQTELACIKAIRFTLRLRDK